MMFPYAAVVLYLALGIALTPRLSPASRPPNPVDRILGALFTPVIGGLSLLCAFASTLWARLLIILDFEPGD